jgi:hypothetical protein
VSRVAAAVALLVATLLALAAAPGALASPTQESTFQDDNRLIYAKPDEVRTALDELAALGADRLRITVVWAAVAPDPGSRTRPDFDAGDPAAYPAGAWDRYDVVAREAAARGMAVNFNLSSPVPLWATSPPPREDVADNYKPDPAEYGRFVTAVGRRYSGTYPGVPRVDYWSIWNEPNQSGWLTPQFDDAGGGRFVEAAPRIYRALADAAWAALQATGHGADTILVGETAPKGVRSRGVKRMMKPLPFVRFLYCVDGKGRPLKGARAAEQGCEAPGDFAAAHPALFAATGYAHHPYELLLAPDTKQEDPDYVTLSSLGRLTRVLDKAFRVYGVSRRLPLYLTEYGYQTDPPDAISGVSFAQQARYLNQSEYLAYRARRVRTLAQFLLTDDKEPIGLTFQSGLHRLDGTPKPALVAYQLPIWIQRPKVRRGRSLRVWGMLRTIRPGATADAAIELRPRGSRRWRTVRTVQVDDPRGYLAASVKLRRGGRVRISALGLHSRAVRVKVRRARRR